MLEGRRQQRQGTEEQKEEDHKEMEEVQVEEEEEEDEIEGEFPFAITPIKPIKPLINPFSLSNLLGVEDEEVGVEGEEVGVEDSFPFLITPIHIPHRTDFPWHTEQGLGSPYRQGQGLGSPYRQGQGLAVEDIELTRMEGGEEEEWLQVGERCHSHIHIIISPSSYRSILTLAPSPLSCHIL